MDDLAFLRTRIESYADYTNDADRRLSDEQIRAYVGEALARVSERLAPGGAAGEVLDQVLLRCQFADQTVIAALDVEDLSATDVASIHGVDRELVALADRSEGVNPAEVAAYVAQIAATLDRRAQIVISRVAAPISPP